MDLVLCVFSEYLHSVSYCGFFIKRTLDYDTIGGLFGDIYLGVHELTVIEKIWAIIIEVVAVVSELIGADSDELTIQIIENGKRLAALREYAQTA